MMVYKPHDPLKNHPKTHPKPSPPSASRAAISERAAASNWASSSAASKWPLAPINSQKTCCGKGCKKSNKMYLTTCQEWCKAWWLGTWWLNKQPPSSSPITSIISKRSGLRGGNRWKSCGLGYMQGSALLRPSKVEKSPNMSKFLREESPKGFWTLVKS